MIELCCEYLSVRSAQLNLHSPIIWPVGTAQSAQLNHLSAQLNHLASLAKWLSVRL